MVDRNETVGSGIAAQRFEIGIQFLPAASRKYSRLPPTPRIAGISSSPSPTGEWKVCTFSTSARVTKWQWTAHKKRLAFCEVTQDGDAEGVPGCNSCQSPAKPRPSAT